MELKSVISQFIYRIEPKPGGGFIATSRDPAAIPIEAATREEVQRKIQERIAAAMAARFPDLQSALAKNGVHLHYHIESKPGGGYTFHHGDPASNAPAHAAEGTTLEHIENFIESKIFSAIVNHLPRDVRGELEQKINAGGLDVEVDRTVSVTTRRAGVPATLFDLGPVQDLSSSSGPASSVVSASSGDILGSAQSGSLNPGESQPGSSWNDPSPSPITRYEKSSSGRIFVFVLLLAVGAALIFFYVHSR
jgi:hypothetical protein